MIKNIVTSAVTAFVVVVLMGTLGLIGNFQSIGADTRFPSGKLSAQGLVLTPVPSTATTTMNLGKTCLAVKDVTGATVYFFIKANDAVSGQTWATTSASCL